MLVSENSIFLQDRISRAILFIRGQRIMLETDLAVLYGIPTKALKQVVKRNIDRFPPDFQCQSKYYDRITRNAKEVNNIRDYISNNSLKCALN
jgi:hypothetical protein